MREDSGRLRGGLKDDEICDDCTYPDLDPEIRNDAMLYPSIALGLCIRGFGWKGN